MSVNEAAALARLRHYERQWRIACLCTLTLLLGISIGHPDAGARHRTGNCTGACAYNGPN